LWYTGLVSEEYKRNPNTTCVVCNKAIYRRPGVLAMNSGKAFCSQACFGKSCRKESPCPICGKLVLAGLNTKTCSRACSNKYREGIKYKIGRPRDKAKTAYFLKVRLLAVRGDKCERCSYDKTAILQVHHKDRDRNNNNLDNLALICPNCHYEDHHLVRWVEK